MPCFGLVFCFTSQSTAMVMSGRSVHLTTHFSLAKIMPREALVHFSVNSIITVYLKLYKCMLRAYMLTTFLVKI